MSWAFIFVEWEETARSVASTFIVAAEKGGVSPLACVSFAAKCELKFHFLTGMNAASWKTKEEEVSVAFSCALIPNVNIWSASGVKSRLWAGEVWRLKLKEWNTQLVFAANFSRRSCRAARRETQTNTWMNFSGLWVFRGRKSRKMDPVCSGLLLSR